MQSIPKIPVKSSFMAYEMTPTKVNQEWHVQGMLVETDLLLYNVKALLSPPL